MPGGFDHGITEHGVPAPQLPMPAPGTSALDDWQQIVPGRPDVPWEQQHHVSKW